jgi:hypothetical protein
MPLGSPPEQAFSFAGIPTWVKPAVFPRFNGLLRSVWA